MKVWITTVARERSLPVDPDPNIYVTVEDLVSSTRTNQVDGFGIVVPEYARLRQLMSFDRFAVGVSGGEISESYILLVRQDGGFEKIEQLQGRSLNVLNTPRMSLATIWLDTILLQAHLNRTTQFFGRITSATKSSRTALPVFFHQTDACLMTRSSFEVMCELNPQMGKQLRILARSQKVVPSGFAFRKDYASPFRAQILTEMARLNESPAGRQILMLTQADRIENHPVSCLDSALEMLATHERLCGETNRVGAVRTPDGESAHAGKQSSP
jgi:phosphonate transport system substrate-binding protein